MFILLRYSNVSFVFRSQLASAGIKARVVSMMCMDVFDAQSEEYKKSVLGEGLPVIAVEAAAVGSWNKYSHVQVCMKTFGASGKGGDLMSKVRTIYSMLTSASFHL